MDSREVRARKQKARPQFECWFDSHRSSFHRTLDRACLGRTGPWWKCIVTLHIWAATVVSRKDNLTLNSQKKNPNVWCQKVEQPHKGDPERLRPWLFSSRVKRHFVILFQLKHDLLHKLSCLRDVKSHPSPSPENTCNVCFPLGFFFFFLWSCHFLHWSVI